MNKLSFLRMMLMLFIVLAASYFHSRALPDGPALPSLAARPTCTLS